MFGLLTYFRETGGIVKFRLVVFCSAGTLSGETTAPSPSGEEACKEASLA